MAAIVFYILLVTAMALANMEETPPQDLDQMNVLQATRLIGAGVVENLVEGVLESTPFVKSILSEKPPAENCKYESTKVVMGVENKKKHLISCLLKDVNPEDDEQTVRDKIVSAAVEVVESIPEENGQCPIEELEKMTLAECIDSSSYVECVTILVFKSIANPSELSAYDELENEEMLMNGV